MFLKIFTVFTIILTSTNLISETYGNLEGRNNFHVIVRGNVLWTDPSVNNVIAVLKDKNIEVRRDTVKESHSSIFLTTFVNTRNEIDDLTVTFNYNLKGELKQLEVTISGKCTYDESNQNVIEVIDLTYVNVKCYLGDVYLGY